MMRMERMDESVVVVKYVWSGKGGKVRGEKIRKELGKLLQAKPRWLIGWRDSAGLLTLNQGFLRHELP